MTDPAFPASPERVSTSGAWLGLGLAVRAALCVMSGVVGLVVSGAVPLVVDWIGSHADAKEVPPEFSQMLELLLELMTILERYTVLAGGAAIVIGFLMFVAALGLIAGIEFGRTSVRALLIADVVHSLAAAAWMVALWLGPLGEWNARYLKAVAGLIEAAPGAKVPMPVDLHASSLINLVSLAASLLVSTGIASLLWWLAGRPFARRWCEARGGGGTAVASRRGPR